jgi:hypothetical protein
MKMLVSRKILHEHCVHKVRMKNITLSAGEALIEKARQVARAERKTLSTVFREWLQDYTSRASTVQDHIALMERLKHINAKGSYKRDQMNER